MKSKTMDSIAEGVELEFLGAIEVIEELSKRN